MKIVLPLLILGLVAIGATDAVSAQSSFLPNGDFANAFNGWSVQGTGCAYNAVGHLASGSARLIAGCSIWSQSFSATNPIDFSISGYAGGSTGTVRVYIRRQDQTTIYLDWDVSVVETWQAVYVPSWDIAGTQIQVGLEWIGADYVLVDEVVVASGGSFGATPTPLATSTPIAGGWGPINQNSARGVVNVGTPTPYFNRGMFDNPVIPINTQGNSDTSGVWNLTMTRRDLEACLPSQLSQVFTDLNVCLAVPLISIDAMSFAGIDLMPTLTMAASVLFFFFIVRLIQTR